MIKKISTATAIALALSVGSAFAADLPSRKAPPYIPPPPPPPMWTGFYVGVNAGGTWSQSSNVWVSSAPIFQTGGLSPFFSNAAALGASGILSSGSNGGFIGGGQIGYNWQFSGNFVAGIEADIQGIAGTSGNNGAAFTAVPTGIGPFAAVTTMNARKSLDYLGTVRGRLGWLATPTLLIYGTGGLAYGGVNLNVNGLQAISPDLAGFQTAGFGGASFSDTRVGWTAGGGVEWMFWPNWSAKVEYLYYDLGSIQQFAGVTSRSNPAGAQLWANATQARARFDGHIVRAGLNYHFNWGSAPVVAKY